jgi:hypothetical protein
VTSLGKKGVILSPEVTRRALPVGAAYVLIYAVFFGPMGITAKDVIGMVTDLGPGVRVGVWCLWILPTIAIANAAIDPPGVRWLRSLPVSRLRLAATSALALAVVELPLAAFCLRGGGPVVAVTFALTAFALHAQLFLGVRDPIDALVLVTGVALAMTPTAPLGLPAAIALAPIAIGRAWYLAPERGRSGGRAILAGPPLVALGLAHLVGVVRTEMTALARAALVVALAGALAGLVANNNAYGPADDWLPLVLGIGAPAFALALSSAVAAALRLEAAATSLLDAHGTTAGERIGAVTFVAALLGLVAGAIFAGALALLTAPDLDRTLAALGTGALVAAFLAGSHRHALADAAKVTARLLVSVLGVAAATSVTAVYLGGLALPLWAVFAAGSLWATAPLAARLRDPVDAWGVEGR